MLTILASMAAGIYGCGGSTADTQAQTNVVDMCIDQLAPGNLKAFQAQCECAVKYALENGDTLDRLASEIKHDTAATDRIAVQAALVCSDAH